MRLALFVLAYNLGNFLRRLALPKKVKHWSLRSLLVKLIKIGAKVVRSGRYTTFQMAPVESLSSSLSLRAEGKVEREVVVSKDDFAEILVRISRLRCCTA